MKTSREANNCARAIVAHLEKITGKEILLEDCMKIVACVQLAIDAKSEGELPKELPADATHIPGVNVQSGVEENYFLDHDESGYPPHANSRKSILEYVEAEFDNMDDGDVMTLKIRREDMTPAQIDALPEL